MSENTKLVPSRPTAAKSEEQQFAQMVLDTLETSGLSVGQFCKKEGIPEWKIYHWRKKLMPKNPDDKIMPAREFKENTPKFIQIAPPARCDSALRIELPSGIQIHISNGCDNNLLREAINILKC